MFAFSLFYRPLHCASSTLALVYGVTTCMPIGFLYVYTNTLLSGWVTPKSVDALSLLTATALMIIYNVLKPGRYEAATT